MKTLTRKPNRERLIEYLLEHEGVTQIEAAKFIDPPISGLSQEIDRLEHEGFRIGKVWEEGQGTRWVRYSIESFPEGGEPCQSARDVEPGKELEKVIAVPAEKLLPPNTVTETLSSAVDVLENPCKPLERVRKPKALISCVVKSNYEPKPFPFVRYSVYLCEKCHKKMLLGSNEKINCQHCSGEVKDCLSRR